MNYRQKREKCRVELKSLQIEQKSNLIKLKSIEMEPLNTPFTAYTHIHIRVRIFNLCERLGPEPVSISLH